jgi:hypothetical protein
MKPIFPPFLKGGIGGIFLAWQNPPKSPFAKGDFKAFLREPRQDNYHINDET